MCIQISVSLTLLLFCLYSIPVVTFDYSSIQNIKMKKLYANIFLTIPFNTNDSCDSEFDLTGPPPLLSAVGSGLQR